MPYTAVITPVFISPRFPTRLSLFEVTLASVSRLETEHSPHIHVIVDDGSPEPNPLRELIRSAADPRIRYLRRERSDTDKQTASNALNYGIDAVLDGHEALPEFEEIATVTPLHSDDLLVDLRARVAALDPADAGAAIAPIRCLRNDGKVRREINRMSARDYIRRGVPPGPVQSIMWKRSTLRGMKNYNRDMQRDAPFEGVYHPGFVELEDMLVTKLTAVYLHQSKLRFAFSPRTVSMAYRFHEDNLSTKSPSEIRNRDTEAARAFYYPSTS